MWSFSNQGFYSFRLPSFLPSPSLSPVCRWLNMLTSSFHLFSHFLLHIFSCFLPRQLHVIPALLTQTVQVEFTILSSQDCFSSSTPEFIIIQAKNLGSCCLLSSLLLTKVNQSFSPAISPSQSLSSLCTPLSCHWYYYCLVFRLVYYYRLLTNYHASSSAFCDLSSIQLPE